MSMPHEVPVENGNDSAHTVQVDYSGNSSTPHQSRYEDKLYRPNPIADLATARLERRPVKPAADAPSSRATPSLDLSQAVQVQETDKNTAVDMELLKEDTRDTLGKESRGKYVIANRERSGIPLWPNGEAKHPTNGETAKEQDRSAENGISGIRDNEKILKLSPAKLYELTSSPKAFPLHVSEAALPSPMLPEAAGASKKVNYRSNGVTSEHQISEEETAKPVGRKRSGSAVALASPRTDSIGASPLMSPPGNFPSVERPWNPSRALSTPVLERKPSSSKPQPTNQSSMSQSRSNKPVPVALEFDTARAAPKPQIQDECIPSPMPPSIPMPPLSFPAYLHLELSSNRPSPHYIYRSTTNDFPYESSGVKIERLLNFLLLPPQLEQVLWFGAIACLDAWLYTFTILPLRFLKALSILVSSWGDNLVRETKFISYFIYSGLGRLWRRGFGGGATGPLAKPVFPNPVLISKRVAEPQSPPGPAAAENSSSTRSHPDASIHRLRSNGLRHRRTKSAPSALLPEHKADLMKGLLIFLSCTILMYFDASMMYHSIRGQAAIKLYVIYNVLEVCDRLLSALGQDVLECLFSKESLERKPDGRSKILRPFWLFLLALLYNLLHSTALFYQVITLNVAVNSYSNALLTLLMSNQFVEIKSTVFKKIEKENLFQLTCADVVERFQLWLMLMIIASRNIMETNSLGLSSAGSESPSPNSTIPLRSSSILPFSFTIFPDWIGQVLGPFLLVLGTEMLVDWLKHAYITKFNNVKPNIYGRFLDILAKDYYSNAFADQNLTRRLGLPVIPLSCLFIRASVQTYHMFIATHLPSPLPSPATSLSTSSSAYSSNTSPATIAALSHIDSLFRGAFGFSSSPSSFSFPSSSALGSFSGYLPTYITVYFTLSNLTTITLFALAFLLLLTLKLLLGMILLSYARRRFKDMKVREGTSSLAEGKRLGGWGMVEVGEDKRRWIYEDDADGLKGLREREARGREKEREEREGIREVMKETNGNRESGKRPGGLGSVRRYSMVAKRIW